MERVSQVLGALKYLLLLALVLALTGSIYATARGRLPAAELIDADPRQLPIYAAWSLLRMTVAFALSLGFSIAYGCFAATSKRAERFLMPLLDILQSVPVLGFFPAATYFFIRLSPGRLGVEMAAVFLIFTSQAWNIAFGVYEAITTIPQDSLDALDSFGVRGLRKFRLLYLPACVPKLVYNSILSWAGGWYFLIACEIITQGPMSYPLPGLGTFLSRASDAGKPHWILLGIGFLVAIIVAMDLFMWRPLGAWAEKYRYEFAASTVVQGDSRVQKFWRRSALGHALRRLGRGLIAPLDSLVDRLSPAVGQERRSPPLRLVGWAVALAASALLAWEVVRAVLALAVTLRWPWPAEARHIPLAIGASFLRLLCAYLIALAWTVPLTAYAADRPRLMRFVQPLAQIGASVPATALFPLIVAIVIRYLGGREVASVLLVLTGMQWYLLFNLIAGAQQIPGDLKEASRSLGLRGLGYFRTLQLPAMLPSLVTGSITSWGGGWNALIVSEYFRFEGRTIEVFGIGAALDRATYGGSAAMTVLTLFSMVTVIVLMNRLFWRRAYLRVADRYKVEY